MPDRLPPQSRPFRARTAVLVVLSLLAGLVGVPLVLPTPPSAAAPPSGLVGRWALDNGSGTTASATTGSKPATLTSGASWAAGVQGTSSLVTNGTTGAAVTSGSVLTTNTSFTVSAYMKVNGVSGAQTAVAQDGSQVSAFFLGTRANKFSFNRPGADSVANSAQADSTTTVVAGTWYHIAGVYNSTAATLALYVNGRLETTVAALAGWNATGNFTIGRGKYSGASSDWTNGSIDDVRAYSRALTADEVSHVSENGHWTFDEGTGTAAADDSQNGYTAALTNAPTWGPGPVGTAAVVLDGSNEFVDANSSVIDTSKSFTVSAWARSDTTTGFHTLLSVDGTNVSGFFLQQRDTNTWAFVRPASDSASPASYATAAAAGTITAGSWYHLTGVYNSVAGTIALYVNGVLQTTVGYTTGFKAGGDLIVGRALSAGVGASNFFNGAVDDVRVFPYVLPAATITAIAAAPAPPVPATPTATVAGTSVTVSWVAPAPIAGSPTTGYTVTPYANGVGGTPVTTSGSATTQVFTGATAGTSYRYTVAATNANGTSAASGQSNAVTPATAPSAPAAPTATAGSLSATVSWTAPAANGSPITGYVVTPFVGSTAQTAQTFASTATTQTVTGLTAGTAYTFTVAATNSVGTGPPSAASNAVTPNASPTIVAASPTNGQVGVAYSYTFTRTGGTSPFAWSVSAGTLPGGLTLAATGVLSGTPTAAGTSSFSVRVTDTSGSTDTRAVTLLVTDKPATPAAPTATAGLTSAVVSWVAPASNGSTITSYVITPTLNGTPQTAITVDPSAKTRTLNNLTAGGIYSFTVAAVNGAGTSAASPASNLVTPYAALNAPSITSVTAGSTSARVSWTAPTSTGGSAITGYVVTPFIGATAQTPQTFTGTATTQTVTGLTAGTAYTFQVAATNSSGTTVLNRIASAGTVAAIDGGPDWVDNGAYRSGGSDYYNFGSIGSLDGSVPATTPPTLFYAERYGNAAGNEMKYAIPVTAGASLKVRLYFANQNGSTASVGARVFDVALEGTTVLPSFDPVAASGGTRIGTMREFAITGDGTVNLDFTHSSQSDPVIYGIEIIRTGVATVGPPSASSSSVTPNASPTLTFAPPPAAQVGVAYSTQLTVNGGTAPFTWSVSAGTLPAGITLSSGGLLSGTPTTVGTSTFTVQVLDGSGQTATRSVTLVVQDRPTAPAAPTATAGVTSASVSWVAPASNGSAITGYVVTPYLGGTAQTAVSFDASVTTRTLSGLTAGGIYTFTVAAVNAVGTSTASPQSNTVVPYAVPNAPAITAATAGDLAVTLTWSTPAANGSPVTGYVVTPFISGVAQPTVTFASTATTQTLSGLTAGTAYTFTVAAQNAAGTGPASAASATVTPNANPTLTFATPPAAALGVAYSTQLTVTGGTAPFTWSVSAGTLPAGITLSSGGLLSGTPTALGTSTFTVQVLDGSGQTATRSVTLVVQDRPTAPAAPTATAGVTSASVSWVAPASNGSAITGYVVTPYLGGTAQTAVSFDASATSRALTGLTAAGSYTFTVAAVNAVGTSAASPQSNTVVPYAVPSAPAITAVTAGDLAVTLTWSTPAANGSPVTGYVVTPFISGVAQPTVTFASTATTRTVTGLTAGTPYTFTVAAQNAAGTGPASAASSSVTPNANPTLTFAAPPAAALGVAYSTQLTVNGGTAPFTWSVSAGTLPAGITLSSGGLLSGTPTALGSSTFTVQVLDGSGQTATRSVTLVVQDRPTAPAAPTATAGVTSASVSWVAPASNGSAITGYVVTPYLAGAAQTPVSFDASTTSRTLTGLTAAGSYTFTVAAVNAVGTSAASPQSNTVVPYAVPSAPAITAVTAGSSSVTLTWSAANGNGSAVSGYLVTPFIAGVAQTPQLFAGAGTTQTVTGLTAGTAYTFTVAAQNAAGTGPASAASASVTPNANPTLTFGNPPLASLGVAYSNQFVVNGGTAPFTWSVSAGTLPAGLTLSAGGLLSGTPTAVGTASVTIRVVDASGQVATRATTVTVADRPAAPATPTATAGLTSAVLTWAAPAANNSAITGYVITPTLNGTVQSPITVDPSAKTRTLNGLTPGGIYSFTVAAVNAAGTSSASGASNLVTPYAALGAPAITSVTAGSTSVTLSWSAPSSTGGSPVTGYVVTPYIGSTAQTPQTFSGTATTRTITGLTAGTAYTFQVAATNSSGTTVLNRLSAEPVTAVDGGPDWADNPAFRSGSTNVYHSGVLIGAYDGTVPSTTPPAIFLAERWGNNAGSEPKYAIPVTAGTTIKVRLYFANTYPGTSSVGARQFDVALESATVLPAFDPVAAAGGTSIATMRDFALTSDGTVNIDFTHRLDSPAVYGIEIVQTGTPTTGPPSTASSAVTPNDSPTLTFATPASGEVGVGYSHQLTVNGGTSPFTWSVSAGSLPTGLSLNPSTGLVSGNPTAAGTASFTVRVVDASGQTATRATSITIAAQPTVTFTPATGEVNVAYSQTPTVSGGTAPFTWALSAGSLPPGLTLNATTGVVAGTPTASGSFTVALRVTDSFGATAGRSATIVIAPLPTLTSAPPRQYAGAGFSFTFAATGGQGPFTYAVVAGSLPDGVSLSAAGVLSGAASQGTSTFTVRAVDANGQAADDPVTLVVDREPVQLVKTANVTSAAPGDTITFTLTVTNISGTDYDGIHFYDPLTDITDDTSYNNDAVLSSGTLEISPAQLDWRVGVAAGATQTLTYTGTVRNPDPGNKIVTGQVSSAFASTSCNPGRQAPGCTATVTVAGLTVNHSASPTTTTPGSTVTFSTVVTNSGQSPQNGISVSESLAGMLDDGSVTGASATVGAVAFVSPTLTWTGSLAPGATVTITYTVKVADPDVGDRSLAGTVVSAAPGSSCPSGAPAASCSVAVPVLVPALTVTDSSSPATTTPGGTVTTTVVATNTGQTAYGSVTLNVALAAALDDAVYAGDATASRSPALGYDAGSGTLSWTGALAVGDSVTLTVPFTVRSPDPGDKAVTTVASSTAAGSSCPVGSGRTACTATTAVLVPGLALTLSSPAATTTPGSTVTYAVLATNTGQTPYTGAVASVDLSGVLDDASYVPGSASAGASVTGSTLTWTGDLAVGASVTISYAVVVKDPDTGNRSLASRVTSSVAGSTCPAGATDGRCLSTVAVLLPGLNLSLVADRSSTIPGGVLRFTVTATNTGETTYAGATVTSSLAGTLDDATLNSDGVVSRGSVAAAPQDGTISWTFDLAPGETATQTGTVTVNDPDTGDRSLIASIASAVAGSSCPAGSSSSACRTVVPVLIPGLTITKTADVSTVQPGGTVHYTVVIANTGETTYPAASVADPLGQVIDDATFDGTATATSGTTAYSASTLTWTGPLAPGQSATVGYDVVVRSPDPGDKVLINRIVSSSAGSTCPAGGTRAACAVLVNVLVPRLVLATTTSVSSTAPGSRVDYTVTVTNDGATGYPAAAFSDSLAGVLDDATYDSVRGVTASTGTAGYGAGAVSWTGALAVGASASVSFSVVVNAADGGNNRLTDLVTSSTSGNTCPAGGTDSRCSAVVPVARLVIVQDQPVTTALPGAAIALTVTFTNTGQVPYTGITIDSPGADTLDDVTGAGNQQATSGSLSVSASGIAWTGSIPVGQTVTVTGTVVVLNPDPGNHLVTIAWGSEAVGSNCPAGNTDPRCVIVIRVLEPGLTITKSANVSAVTVGGQVAYTITVANSGQSDYVGATVSDDLTGVLDDATLDAGATATRGTVSVAAPGLVWTGDLTAGQTATISYSVTTADPGTGNHQLLNEVTSNAVGSSCPAGQAADACQSVVGVRTPRLTLEKTADVTAVNLGQPVTYTVTVTNSGQTSYPDASFGDDLTGVLDDAALDVGSLTATRGTVDHTATAITWVGALAPGQTAQIRYRVLVDNPDDGDHSLVNAVVSSSRGSTCPSGGADLRCRLTIPVTDATALTLGQTADVVATAAGQRVIFTVEVRNGTAAPVSAAFADDLSGVLDDAAYVSRSASSGTTSFSGTTLGWSGTVPALAAIAVSVTVQVDDPPGGDLLLTPVVSSATLPDSNNCAAGSTDSRCTVTVGVARLSVTQYADEATVTPGGLIHLTQVFVNTGRVDYRDIAVSSPRADTSDDALPTGDQSASSGVLTRTDTALIWSGDIAVGQTVTVVRTLRVRDPDPGNQVVTAVLTSAAAGNNCPAGGTDPACSFSVAVLTPQLSITKNADRPVVDAGGAVHYTIVVANTGQTPYVGAVVSDRLDGLLDDGDYAGGLEVDRGSAAYAAPVLTWTGDLAVGQSATIRYTVTARDPGTGDKLMINTVESSAVGSTCLPATTNAACASAVVVLTPALTIASAVDHSTALPGDVVRYTLTVTNTGQTSYPAAGLQVPLAGVLDDASYAGPATADVGTAAVVGGALVWSGALAPGDQATIGYSVTVNTPVGGDYLLAQTVESSSNASNCAVGSPDPRCRTEVALGSLHLAVDDGAVTVAPTDLVTYTGTFTNVGRVPYTSISVSNSFVGALDDATYDGNATASSGSLVAVLGSGRITWTGDVPVGGTVTITGVLRVRSPDPGDQVMTTRLSSSAAATNCPPASADPSCVTSATVLTPHLSITKVADTTTTTPGSVVTYTVTVTDDGQTGYVGATVTDDLADVLSEASYQGGSLVGPGSLVLTGSQLTWTGDLAVGGSAVITYAVRVNDPDLGDLVVSNAVTSDALGSTCPTRTTNPACSVTVAVLVPALTVGLAADVTTTTPGSTVGYTLTVTNTGRTAYTSAVVTADLGGVLDDGAYAGGQAAPGSLVLDGSALRWTGDLAPGATAVVTYAVTVADPDVGDRALVTSVSSTARGSTCTPGTPCVSAVAVLVPGLAVSTTADVATATPGSLVTFTTTLTNTGQTDYVGATATAALAGVLDDATLRGPLLSSTGVVSVSGSTLSWTGSLAVGASVQIRYTVEVEAAADLGDHTLSATTEVPVPGSACPAGGSNPSCTATVVVLVPALTITTAASTATTTPGRVVGYTVVITNSGESDYAGISVTDSLAGLLDEADLNGDAQVVGGGLLDYAAPALTWTGDLPVGATVTVTFSVTVHDPATGDGLLTDGLTSAAPGSSCPTAALPGCSAGVAVLIPALTLATAADRSSVTAGDPVTYLVTVTNTGQAPYDAATVTDDLSGILDDGSVGAPQASAGTASVTGSTLTWSGALAVGESVTISYVVTTAFPVTGDARLVDAVASDAYGAGCVGGVCGTTVTVDVPRLDVSKRADTTVVVAGGVVAYTIIATNTGAAAYSSVGLTDDLAGVLDDATYVAGEASRGTLAVTDGTLSWTGSVPVGGVVTITYRVRTDDVDAGDAVLDNTVVADARGATCGAGGPAGCRSTVTVLPVTLEVSDLDDTFTLTGPPGATVSREDAVSLTVTTNNPAGYIVTVAGTQAELTPTSSSNPDRIPLDRLKVGDADANSWTPLTQVPLTVHAQTGPSSPDGDAVSDDYSVDIPFVASDTYSTTLEYIVTTQ